MNKVLFKVDDFCFDGWGTNKPVYENWDKFIDICAAYPSVKLSVGIVGRTLESCPSIIIDALKKSIENGCIELWNHSYEHADTPVIREDFAKNQYKIKEIFGSPVPRVYGAPRNDVSQVSHLQGAVMNRDYDLGIKMFKTDIPINAYQELEKVTDSSFVNLTNFLEHYKPQHEETKVYQMHPTVWDDWDREAFNTCLAIMIKDGKEWIFASQYE